MTLSEDADLATDLVTRAAELALQMRSAGLRGEQKTSVSDVVTAADRAAEKLIREELNRLRPEDGVMGEEGTLQEGTSGRTWVIDPVDGTYNFLQGSTYWCSALALRDDTAPTGDGLPAASSTDPAVLLGAVHQPQADRLWLGVTGQATTLNGRAVGVAAHVQPGLLSAGTYLHPTRLTVDELATPWTRAASRAATIRMLGSGSCDLGGVSTGELGFWFQFACPQWDWLPGKALVRGAGGETAVVRVNGNPWFVAGPPVAVARTVANLEGREEPS